MNIPTHTFRDPKGYSPETARAMERLMIAGMKSHPTTDHQRRELALKIVQKYGTVSVHFIIQETGEDQYNLRSTLNHLLKQGTVQRRRILPRGENRNPDAKLTPIWHYEVAK